MLACEDAPKEAQWALLAAREAVLDVDVRRYLSESEGTPSDESTRGTWRDLSPSKEVDVNEWLPELLASTREFVAARNQKQLLALQNVVANRLEPAKWLSEGVAAPALANVRSLCEASSALHVFGECMALIQDNAIEVLAVQEFPKNATRSMKYHVVYTECPVVDFKCRKGSWLFHLTLYRDSKYCAVFMCHRLCHVPTEEFMPKEYMCDMLGRMHDKLYATKMRALLSSSDFASYVKENLLYLFHLKPMLATQGFTAKGYVTVNGKRKTMTLRTMNDSVRVVLFPSISFKVSKDDIAFTVVSQRSYGSVRMVAKSKIGTNQSKYNWSKWDSAADIAGMVKFIETCFLIRKGHYGVCDGSGNWLNGETMRTWLAGVKKQIAEQFPAHEEAGEGLLEIDSCLAQESPEIRFTLHFGGRSSALLLAKQERTVVHKEDLEAHLHRYPFETFRVHWKLQGEEATVTLDVNQCGAPLSDCAATDDDSDSESSKEGEKEGVKEGGRDNKEGEKVAAPDTKEGDQDKKEAEEGEQANDDYFSDESTGLWDFSSWSLSYAKRELCKGTYHHVQSVLLDFFEQIYAAHDMPVKFARES